MLASVFDGVVVRGVEATYADGLQEITIWNSGPAKRDEKRWNQRLQAFTASITAGNKWRPATRKQTPKKNTALGMWLHIQRMKYRRNELDQDKEAQLNTLLPGWRDGRSRGAARIPQHPTRLNIDRDPLAVRGSSIGRLAAGICH